LDFVVNSEALFRFVEMTTGCDRIGCFVGRVFRGTAEMDDYDVWHDDVGRGRLAAMSVNLSNHPYQGGSLELRDAARGSVTRVDNPRPGDAVLFRIATGLEHRITAITGSSPRTAFAGWFCSEPDVSRMFAARRLKTSS
jgi:hypothetical protein